MNLTHPSELKALLTRHGFAFSKSLGQNFLIDRGVLESIAQAASLDKNACVLEIGPGAGTLTRLLAERCGRIAAVEIDRALIPILEETMAEFPHFMLVHQDIMKTDLAALTQQAFGDNPFHVVANLPYYITTPIVMSLLEGKLPVCSLTLMVQKEVAARMTAAPGTKDYGALTVAVQFYTRPTLVCRAEPHCFLPQPKVASSVIHLEVLNPPAVTVKDSDFFFRLVKSAFGQRRKTLVNALTKSPHLHLERPAVENALTKLGLDTAIRGERLSVGEFAALADLLAS